MVRWMVAALVLLSVATMGTRAEAQYIPELPTTTVAVGGGGVERPPTGHGVEDEGGGSLPVTGSELGWLGRAGAALLVAGGLVLMAPGRRRRSRDLAAARTADQA